MYLYILLIGIIIALILIIIILIKNLNSERIMYDTLEKDYNDWSEELRFSKREVDRLKEQIKVYEKDEEEKPDIIINNKKIKKSSIYKGYKVLVGDYIEISSENTMKMLQSYGITVDIVRTGEDIVDRIKHGYKYDIIFTNNIYNKGYDGRTTLDNLKEIKGFNTPVVIHTINQNERNKFVNIYGFDEYIAKPLDQDKLKPVLDKFLKKKKGDSSNVRKRNR